MNNHNFGIDVISRYNNENCTLRLTIRNDDNEVTDIYEGPMNFIVHEFMKRVSPETKYKLRKIRK